MTETAMADDHAILTEPATLTIRRLLPGPVERIWSYLTDSDLRSTWLAAGVMGMAVDTPFELVWRNETLTNPPGTRPDGFPDEHRMQSRITEFVPSRRLSFTWNGDGEVTFDLEPQGEVVLLTVIHRRLPPDRGTRLNVAGGWHMHLDILVARATGAPDPEPFWDGWARRKAAYAQRLPA